MPTETYLKQKTMSYNTFTLPNGLRIIHAPNQSNVAYCGFAVDAGTRDENEQEQGMAHFVEHLIFKGTQKRHAWHILNRMENVGGDLNAYTNKEETVIYSAFLVEHFSRAAELLADIVFHSTFPQHEIDKEVEVIIDEIQSYEDSPSELIFDDFEELIFPNHPLGRNILGKPDLLRSFKSEHALNFTSRFYKATNMIFFIQGNIDFKKVIRTIEKVTADIPFSITERQRTEPFLYIPKTLTLNKETHQAHVMIGSRLNVSLRERRGLVYNVEANLTSYTDTGVFCIYFGTDPEDADRCIGLVHKELKKLRDSKLSSSQLSAAKKQIIGQIGVAGDNFENNALDMGKTFLHYGKFEGSEEVFKRIEMLTAEHLWDIANEMFDENYLSTLIYL